MPRQVDQHRRIDVMLILPGDLSEIKRDSLDLVRGPSGTPVVIHHHVESGGHDSESDIYADAPSYTNMTEDARAYVVEVTNPNISFRPTRQEGPLDVQHGDHVFYFEPSVDFSSYLDPWIEVPGLGEFMIEENPPLKGWSHANAFPSAIKFLTEIYCRIKHKDGS